MMFNDKSLWGDIQRIESSDENVSKYVFKKNDAVAEAVLYKYPTYQERTVICCSTQSGCPVGCRFCGAGDNFVRSLTWQEIVSQPIRLINDIFNQNGFFEFKKLQIMFMSMGEPMMNYDNLEKAIRHLHKLFPEAQLLISTSAPCVKKSFDRLNKLSKEIPTVGLQFSVHESTDEARKKLIPSKTSKLDDISRLGLEWHNSCGRRPFFNYCVHEGNGSEEDAVRLTNLFAPDVWECTLSVVCERDENVAAANKRQEGLVKDFVSKMLKHGHSVRMFNPAGQDDIGGGCGMLWFVQSWMKDNPDKAKPSAGFGLPKIHAPSEK